MSISVNPHGIHIAADGIMVYGFISPKDKFASHSFPCLLGYGLYFKGGTSDSPPEFNASSPEKEETRQCFIILLIFF